MQAAACQRQSGGCRTKLFVCLGTAHRAVRTPRRGVPTSEEFCHVPQSGRVEAAIDRGHCASKETKRRGDRIMAGQNLRPLGPLKFIRSGVGKTPHSIRMLVLLNFAL